MLPSRLLIPAVGSTPSDPCLAELARFSGIECETAPLQDLLSGTRRGPGTSGTSDECLALNVEILKEHIGNSPSPLEIVKVLIGPYRFLLIYNFTDDPFTRHLLRYLSDGSIDGVTHATPDAQFTVSLDSRTFSGALAGLSVGEACSSDLALSVNSASKSAYVLLGEDPVLYHHSNGRASLAFVAGGAVADIHAKTTRRRLEPQFSRLVLPLLGLRLLFGDACWKPRAHHATLIIDDPALWKRFGFIRFDPALLRLLDEYGFHMSIAFIPYNHRRSNSSVADMFRRRPDRLSLCIHGNDHTSAEFRSEDLPFLNSALKIARSRMASHQSLTGIPQDNIMVFPQGTFSTHAMTALAANNFVAAINSGGYPQDEGNRLTLADVISPAVHFRGFPVFFRQYLRDLSLSEIALHHFFGKPLLIAEHHQIFKDPSVITTFVSMVNSVIPEVKWSSAQTAVENSTLYRRAPDGTIHARVYANQGVLHNASRLPLNFVVERPNISSQLVSHIEVQGQGCDHEFTNDHLLRFKCSIGPNEQQRFRVVYRDELTTTQRGLGIRWRAQVFARRLLSDLRDMYLHDGRRLKMGRLIQRSLRGRI